MQKEGENEGLILTEAERRGIITKLDRWEFNNLDDDGGTLELQEKLSRKPNYATDVFMADWDGEAKKKYGHLAPPGYLEAIKEDSGRYERERVARNAKADEIERSFDYERPARPSIPNVNVDGFDHAEHTGLLGPLRAPITLEHSEDEDRILDTSIAATTPSLNITYTDDTSSPERLVNPAPRDAPMLTINITQYLAFSLLFGLGLGVGLLIGF